MVKSIKRYQEFSDDLESLEAYIHNVLSDIKGYAATITDKHNEINNVYSQILSELGTINNKIPENVVDILNNMGTFDDFVEGFNNGFYTE